MVSHGSPFRLDPSDPMPSPAVRAVPLSQGAQTTRRTAGSFRGTKGAPQVGTKPRINHDVAREMAQTKVSRLEKAEEAMGDMHGLVVEVVKAELMKARTASKKPSVDVEINECRKFITTAERRIKELDTERAKECTLLAEAQEHLER